MNKISIILFAFLTSMSQCYADQNTAETEAKIADILTKVHTDLRAGNTESATNTLETATGNFHSVKLELGLIQTLMQGGNYRHALSAAAHTQAEHPDDSDTTVIYAWLLALGGQISRAIPMLEQNQKLYPQNSAVALLLNQSKKATLVAAELPSRDMQLRPFTPLKSIIPPTRKYLATGIIIDNGKRIIAPLKALEKFKVLQARTALGQEIDIPTAMKIADANVAILTLPATLKLKQALAIEDKPTFPGTPIYIIGFTAGDNTQAEWPQLKIDILGTPSTNNTDYPVHLENLTPGSAVLNQRGNLLGIITGVSGTAMNLLRANPSFAKPSNVIPSSALMTIDAIYEKVLGNTVQIFGSE